MLDNKDNNEFYRSRSSSGEESRCSIGDVSVWRLMQLKMLAHDMKLPCCFAKKTPKYFESTKYSDATE